jgi:two-component system, OmpR family, KDP operon response regulator KdpE
MKSDIRVLIIEDESGIRNILRINLMSHGYKITEAETGKLGLSKALEFHPHLIILDLGLPDISGLEVLRELRKWTFVPIIIITVQDNEEKKVELLDAGADDYLTKPFGTKELLARVRVCLRNHGLIEATPIFKSGDLEIDLSKHLVLRDKMEVKLTKTEFEVLARLVREHGKVVPQNQLLKQIWGAVGLEQGHYIRIYINQLRKKLEDNPSDPKHILTEPGVGYRLV